MTKTQYNFAVLFSDVSGSTHIYETLGDTKASNIINDVLSLMSAIVKEHAGTVVKTIGDEVMCRFYDANNAVEAACAINEQLANKPAVENIKLAVRTGIHWGPALLQEDGDLLGDVVNVAARMTGIAKAREIIATQGVFAKLNAVLQYKCREFDRAAVKGKSEEVIIYEIVWEPKDVTRISSIVNSIPLTESTESLEIRYQDQVKILSGNSSPLQLGRSKQCDLMIASPLASRSHATIKFSRGKFILTDQSTNGTYIQFEKGKQFYLRRENLPLSGSGIISLGEEITPNSAHLIYYKL